MMAVRLTGSGMGQIARDRRRYSDASGVRFFLDNVIGGSVGGRDKGQGRITLKPVPTLTPTHSPSALRHDHPGRAWIACPRWQHGVSLAGLVAVGVILQGKARGPY
jgi:hypothetical protein